MAKGWQKENIRQKGRKVNIRWDVGSKTFSEGDREKKLMWKETPVWENSERQWQMPSCCQSARKFYKDFKASLWTWNNLIFSLIFIPLPVMKTLKKIILGETTVFEWLMISGLWLIDLVNSFIFYYTGFGVIFFVHFPATFGSLRHNA